MIKKIRSGKGEESIESGLREIGFAEVMWEAKVDDKPVGEGVVFLQGLKYGGLDEVLHGFLASLPFRGGSGELEIEAGIVGGRNGVTNESSPKTRHYWRELRSKWRKWLEWWRLTITMAWWLGFWIWSSWLKIWSRRSWRWGMRSRWSGCRETIGIQGS
jgi:hypothetical protein